jgi:hypothetical protein
MAVYVIAIAAVVLVLFGAYRALGESPAPVDTDRLLKSLLGEIRASIADVSGSLETSVTERAVDTASAGRRRLAALRQMLDRLAAQPEVGDSQLAARLLLTSAVTDAEWAWRMLQARDLGPALHPAVAALRDHADECCVEAATLLRASPSGEPRDGP